MSADTHSVRARCSRTRLDDGIALFPGSGFYAPRGSGCCSATGMAPSEHVLIVDGPNAFRARLSCALEQKGVPSTQVESTQGTSQLTAAMNDALFSRVIVDFERFEAATENIFRTLELHSACQVVATCDSLPDFRIYESLRCARWLPRTGLDVEMLANILVCEPLGLSGFSAEMRLSPREHSVLLCMTEGFSVDATAERLGCKAATIKTYVQRIFSKTCRGSRAEVLALVIAWLTSPARISPRPLRRATRPQFLAELAGR